MLVMIVTQLAGQLKPPTTATHAPHPVFLSTRRQSWLGKEPKRGLVTNTSNRPEAQPLPSIHRNSCPAANATGQTDFSCASYCPEDAPVHDARHSGWRD